MTTTVGTRNFEIPIGSGTKGAGLALIVLTGPASQNENTAPGTTIGTLAVLGGTGTYTFTKTVDADTAFTLTGTTLSNSFAWDYETKTSHDVTIHADNGAGSVLDRTFTIAVNNVFEVLLAALTLSNSTFVEHTAVGTLIGNVIGKTAGSILLLTDNAAGKVALVGTALNVNADVANSTTPSFTCQVTESHPDGSNSPRVTTFTITVSAIVSGFTPSMKFNDARNSMYIGTGP